MWDYSEKVKEHFFDPKNAGAVSEANATGDVGSLSCGDALRLTLKVDPATDIILESGFQTFGCGSAIASSSALTEMIKGLHVNDALKISNQDIADFLDGLPPEKMHCSVMGREALQAAVANYRGEEIEDDHEEGALVCKCFAIDEVMVRDTIQANQLKTVEDVTNYTKAGGGCSSCHEGIERILTEALNARGESFVPAPIAIGKKKIVTIKNNISRSFDASKHEEQAPEQKQAESFVGSVEDSSIPQKPASPKVKRTSLQRIRIIEKTLEEIRPSLQRDRGDVELIDVEGKDIYVKLIGACVGCQLATATLGGVQQKLIENLGEFVKILPVTSEEQLTSLEGV